MEFPETRTLILDEITRRVVAEQIATMCTRENIDEMRLAHGGELKIGHTVMVRYPLKFVHRIN